MRHLNSIPQPLLEQWFLGQLPEAGARKVEERLRGEGLEPAQVRQELAKDNAELLAGMPFSRLEARLDLGDAPKQYRGLWFPMLGLGAAALAAMLVFVLAAPDQELATLGGAGPKTEDGIRIKGNDRLMLFRMAGTQSQQLEDGAAVAAGDGVQVLFQVDAPGCVAVYSVDGNGAVSKHFPADGGCCSQVTGGSLTSAPRGFVLDATPGFERFFLLKSGKPFDCASAEKLLVMAGRSAAVPSNSGLEVESILLVKGNGGEK